MKNEHNICHYCGGRLYTLANSHAKCSRCAKKYSLKKAAFDEAVIVGFCQNKSAHILAKELGVTYLRVYGRYMQLRSLIMQHYSHQQMQADEFEEYLYMPNKRVFDGANGFNFITFCTDKEIYNYLLPPIRRFYTLQESKELGSFMRRTHIAKLSHAKNRITDFWDYFEEFMRRFKGVGHENFALYLKEAEFKFNHPDKDEQINLLLSLWY